MNKHLLKLLRPHQYVKNSFVFLGFIFAHQWQWPTILQSLYVFCAFSAVASCVYILNDLLDIEADRRHPTKRNRPLASGKVSVRSAITTVAVLLGLTFGLLAYYQYWTVLFILLTYILLNIAYSFHLKHVVLLDVFIIAAGFILRILAGTIGLLIKPSAWLLLCSLMLTLFLGFCKRFTELQQILPDQGQQNQTRRVLDDYSLDLLNSLISISAACAIMAFAIYTVSPTTIALHNTENLIYTLPLVIYGVYRYLYLTKQRAKGTDTAKDIFTDRHLLITAVLWISLTTALLRWGSAFSGVTL